MLATAMAVGGFSFGVSQFSRAEDKAAGQRDSDVTTSGSSAEKRAAAEAATFPAGIELKKDAAKDDHDAILKPIGTATEATLTKDGFNDVVERLVDQDRNRIGKEGATDKKQNYQDLNAKVAALNDAWKAKYGEKFDLSRSKAFAGVATIAGEIKDPQAVATAWPVPAFSPAAGEAVEAAAKQPGQTEVNKDSNLEKGRDVAIATIPASHDLPALHVSLILEAVGWKIDIPNPVSGQQLHDNLLKHVDHILSMQNQWPVDKDSASMMAAHHILMGVVGVDAPPVDHQKKSADDSAAREVPAKVEK
jgi:hypothetical protein